MDAIEIEAMLIRHKAAMAIQDSVPDPWRLLSMVVCPDEDALRASLAVARADGPSVMAMGLARKVLSPEVVPGRGWSKRARQCSTTP